jgi:hypothetical protein
MIKPINDINYNLTSKLYLDLKVKIRELKNKNKPLLIKINSHPCAGKSTFIQRHDGSYLGCKLIDNTWTHTQVRRKDRNSSLLLKNKKKRVVLFGSVGKDNDMDLYENVIYIFVMPKLINLYKYIVHRQLKHLKEPGFTETRDSDKDLKRLNDLLISRGWTNPMDIIKTRNNLYSNYIIKDSVQIKPLFYSFKEALEFCVNTYDHS